MLFRWAFCQFPNGKTPQFSLNYACLVDSNFRYQLITQTEHPTPRPLLALCEGKSACLQSGLVRVTWVWSRDVYLELKIVTVPLLHLQLPQVSPPSMSSLFSISCHAGDNYTTTAFSSPRLINFVSLNYPQHHWPIRPISGGRFLSWPIYEVGITCDIYGTYHVYTDYIIYTIIIFHARGQPMILSHSYWNRSSGS